MTVKATGQQSIQLKAILHMFGKTERSYVKHIADVVISFIYMTRMVPRLLGVTMVYTTIISRISREIFSDSRIQTEMLL